MLDEIARNPTVSMVCYNADNDEYLTKTNRSSDALWQGSMFYTLISQTGERFPFVADKLILQVEPYDEHVGESSLNRYSRIVSEKRSKKLYKFKNNHYYVFYPETQRQKGKKSFKPKTVKFFLCPFFCKTTKSSQYK